MERIEATFGPAWALPTKPFLEVKEAGSDRILWSHEMEGVSGRYLGNAVVLQYPAREKAAGIFLREFPDVKKRLDALPKSDSILWLEVLSFQNGRPMGHVLVDNGNGSIQIRAVHVAGRSIFMEDSNNRTLAYSLDTGERTGQQFGSIRAVDPARGLVGVENEPGKVTVYDGSMRPVADFIFPDSVIYAGFDGVGKRLLAVTSGQDVFIQDVP